MAKETSGPLSLSVSKILKQKDILVALGVVGILLFMIIPLPVFLLDVLLSFNITLSLCLLLVTMYILKPLELSAFPSLLLLATLFRLSLNIASTRIILLHGNEGIQAAGQVIKSFGAFAVGGNFVVGLIVFCILVIINFMVITKGSGRIAEVAARFTLDAMPGKQMAIDADLNGGLINEEEARARRRSVAKESEYYGAMDGASKFVRGDAIAGILITLINIVGGLAIGVLQKGMSFSAAAFNYTLLTVGDGLVSQIPALLISTAAGIIVSRAASESSLGEEITSQILLQPKAIGITGGVLFAMALIPGLPTLPFLFLGLMSGGLAYWLRKAKGMATRADMEQTPQKEKAQTPEGIESLPPLDLLGLEVGYGLIPLVDVRQGGELLDRVRAIRKQIGVEIGIVVPPVHIQDNLQLKPGEYAILLKGNRIAGGELLLNHFLAMDPGNAREKITGIKTKEPTYGLPAFWIKKETREMAMAKGYTVVDHSTVLTTHLADIIRRHAYELLGRQEAQTILDKVRESHPKVVDELIPNAFSLGGVVRVLQNLLKEQIPIRDLLTILETLADWAPVTKDVDTLTEHVRQALARTITRLYQGADGTLRAITLDEGVERAILSAIQETSRGAFLILDPALAQKIITGIGKKLEKFTSSVSQPVVLCSAQTRGHLKKFLERFIPSLTVLSYNEIMNNVKILSLGTVGLTDAD